MSKKLSFTDRLENSKLISSSFSAKVPEALFTGLKSGRKLGGSHIGTIVEPYFEDGKMKTVEIPLKLWQRLMIHKANENKDIKLIVAEALVSYLENVSNQL